MYRMHTLGAFKCMHVVHIGGFRFGGGFGYMYLSVGHQGPGVNKLIE